MRNILLYTVLLLGISCKQEITVNIKDRPAALVVNAELNTDSLMGFKLTLTQNITDNADMKIVENATIQIMDKDSVLLETLLHAGNGNYASGLLKPRTSRRYIFKIQDSRGLHWADENMPDSLSLASVDTARILFQGQQNFFQFTVRLQDKANQNNYYGLKIRRKYETYLNGDTIVSEDWQNIETLDLILTENPESRFSKKQLLFSDRYFNGSLQDLKFGTGGIFGKPSEKTLALDLQVYAYSENTYRYFVSLNEHLLYQNDPFSQPSMLRGNVSNAYGAVIAQYISSFRFEFR